MREFFVGVVLLIILLAGIGFLTMNTSMFAGTPLEYLAEDSAAAVSAGITSAAADWHNFQQQRQRERKEAKKLEAIYSREAIGKEVLGGYFAAIAAGKENKALSYLTERGQTLAANREVDCLAGKDITILGCREKAEDRLFAYYSIDGTEYLAILIKEGHDWRIDVNGPL